MNKLLAPGALTAWSTWLLIITSLLAFLEKNLDLIKSEISPEMFGYVTFVILIARLIRQKSSSLALAASALFLAGCGNSPARQVCYAEADAWAFSEYVSKCREYGTLETCPSVADIEKEHEEMQGACP